MRKHKLSALQAPEHTAVSKGCNAGSFDGTGALMHAGTNYIETLRMQIHANCRIRRVYFSDRLYTEEELPTEFK